MPAVETIMLYPISPFDQRIGQSKQPSLITSSWIDSPGQIEIVSAGPIMGLSGKNKVSTSIGMEAGLLPQELLRMAEKLVKGANQCIVMLGPVSPFDQATLQPEHTLSTVSTTESPGHSIVLPEAETVGASGAVPTVIWMVLETALSPQILLRVAV